MSRTFPSWRAVAVLCLYFGGYVGFLLSLVAPFDSTQYLYNHLFSFVFVLDILVAVLDKYSLMFFLFSYNCIPSSISRAE